MPKKYKICIRKVEKEELSRYGYEKYNPYAICSSLKKSMKGGMK